MVSRLPVRAQYRCGHFMLVLLQRGRSYALYTHMHKYFMVTIEILLLQIIVIKIMHFFVGISLNKNIKIVGFSQDYHFIYMQMFLLLLNIFHVRGKRGKCKKKLCMLTHEYQHSVYFWFLQTINGNQQLCKIHFHNCFIFSEVLPKWCEQNYVLQSQEIVLQGF